MKEHRKKAENRLANHTSSSKQAPIPVILQAYKNKTLGKGWVQPVSETHENSLSNPSAGQAPAATILQRYGEGIQRNDLPKEEACIPCEFDSIPKVENKKCVQREALASDGVLDGNVNYTRRMNNGALSAWRMSATNIEFSSPRVFQLPIGNSPTATPPGWQRVQGCVRMHLLNGQLGGTGAHSKNLAPGSYDLNHLHYTEVEKHLVRHVRDRRGKLIIIP
ncbi:MAG: hypothetical protein LUD02_01285 [Tannerellaceae bacterium]|nr:hypothetical protein [Tannerellaceae bacterium]MCD8262937.1 hypothetical protein [Tannerellaceae bacterium]